MDMDPREANAGKSKSKKSSSEAVPKAKQSSQKQLSSARKPIVVLLVLLLVALAGSVWLVNRAKTTVALPMKQRPIGANVDVTGDKVPFSIKATELPESEVPIKESVALGPEVEMSPDGQLPAPVTLRFALNKQVSQDDVVVIGMKRTAESEWEYLAPEVSEDGLYASITTDHFTRFRPVQVLIDFAKEFKQELVDSFTGEFMAKAEKPHCELEDKAREADYIITSSHKDTLYWCFGIEDEKRVLKVVNRKRYPVDLIYPNLELIDNGTAQLELRQIIRRFEGDYSILFPHDEAVFGVNLADQQTGGVRSDFYWNSKSAVYIDGLQKSLEALNGIIFKFGLGKQLSATDIYKAIDLAMQSKDCTNAINKDNVFDFFRKCFASDAVLDMIGGRAKAFKWTNTIFGMGSAAGGLADWFAGIFSGYIDEGKEASDYYIMITKGLPEDAHNLVSKPVEATSNKDQKKSGSGMPCPEPTPGGTIQQDMVYWMLCGVSLTE